MKGRLAGVCCSNCGQPAKKQRGDFPLIEQEGLQVRLYDADLIVFDACGNVDPIIPRMNDLMRAISAAIISKPYRITGAETRFLRKYLGMTGEQFSRLLHVDKTTLSKWENDEDPIGQQSDLLVRSYVLLRDQKLRRLVDAPEELFPQVKSARRRLKINYDLLTGAVGYADAATLVTTGA